MVPGGRQTAARVVCEFGVRCAERPAPAAGSHETRMQITQGISDEVIRWQAGEGAW
jgi:hypothetical protein